MNTSKRFFGLFFISCIMAIVFFYSAEPVLARDRDFNPFEHDDRDPRSEWYTIDLNGKHAGYIEISYYHSGKEMHAYKLCRQKLVFSMGENKQFITENTFGIHVRGAQMSEFLVTEHIRRMADGRVEKSETEWFYNKDKGEMILNKPGDPKVIKWNAPVYLFWEIGGELKPDRKKITLNIFDPNDMDVKQTTIENKGEEKIKIKIGNEEKEFNCIRWELFAGKTLIKEWRTADGKLIKRIQPMFGPHEGVIQLSTKEVAEKIENPPVLWDFMRFGNVKGAISDDDMRPATSITYNLNLPPEIIKSVKWDDERQKVVKTENDLLVLTITKPAPPKSALALPLADDVRKKFEEYLAPNKYLDFNDPKIVELAKQIVGDEKDSFKAAVKIAKWVFDNLKKEGSPSYSTASGALKDKRGDCSEHSVLFAALLRAAGIPSRVSFGMAYHEGGFFVHIWTEAYVGEWVSMDAHWGEAISGVGHIALRKSSLKDVADLGEIMKDATAIGGQLKAEIVEYTLEGKTHKTKKKEKKPDTPKPDEPKKEQEQPAPAKTEKDFSDDVKAEAEKLIKECGGINGRDKLGWTPLHNAIWDSNKALVELLIIKGADITIKNNDGWTPLNQSIRNREKEIMELLIAKGADLNVKNNSGWTTLHSAVLNGDKDLIELLIAKGVNIEVKNEDGATALNLAVREFDKEKIVELLIAKGADVNTKDNNDVTLLHWAATKNTRNIAKMLIAKGANIDAVNKLSNSTPLHYAVWNNKIDVINFLIEEGADVNIKDNKGRTVLDDTNNNYITKLLRYNGAKSGDDLPDDKLTHKERVEQEVEHLIKEYGGVDGKNIDGWTPLHEAANKFQKDVVILLISKGANVNVKDKYGITPLHWTRCRKIAEILIDKGAQVNAKDSFDITPLHEVRTTLIAELLLAMGADINAKDKRGRTPLDTAKNDEIKKNLLNHGAKSGKDLPDDKPAEPKKDEPAQPLPAKTEKDFPDDVKAGAEKFIKLFGNGNINGNREGGLCSLHIAVIQKENDIAKYLIFKGANINQKDPKNLLVPLHCAAVIGNKEMAEYLINKGADINAKNIGLCTPLHDAVTNKNNEIVELLISKGADINTKDKFESTPLHAAVAGNNKDIIEFLISKGADINAKNIGGMSPLFLAIIDNKYEIASILIKKGANVNLPDNNQCSPLHFATSQGREKLVELLIDNGANPKAQDILKRTPFELTQDDNIRKLLRKNKSQLRKDTEEPKNEKPAPKDEKKPDAPKPDDPKKEQEKPAPAQTEKYFLETL